MKSALASEIKFTPEHYAEQKTKKPVFTIKNPTRQDKIDFKYAVNSQLGNVVDFKKYFLEIAKADEAISSRIQECYNELQGFQLPDPPNEDATEDEKKEYGDLLAAKLKPLNEISELEDQAQQDYPKVREVRARFVRDQEQSAILAFKLLVTRWTNIKVKYEADADADGILDEVLEQISDDDVHTVGNRALELLQGNAITKKN